MKIQELIFNLRWNRPIIYAKIGHLTTWLMPAYSKNLRQYFFIGSDPGFIMIKKAELIKITKGNFLSLT